MTQPTPTRSTVVAVTLDVPARLPVSDFRNVLAGLTDLIAAFSDFGRLPKDEPPSWNLATGVPARSPKRRTSSAQVQIRNRVRNVQRQTADDLRILNLSYASPVEVMLLASGATATVVLTWFGVVMQWGNVRANWQRNRTTVAKEKMQEEAYELIRGHLPEVIHRAVQTDRLAEVLTTVANVTVLEPGDAGRRQALPPTTPPSS